MATYDIVPTHLVVKAMQDSGYRNAAYAIAELIDNAIQADATSVELLCIESEDVVVERRRSRLDQLAVLDNGNGMSPEVLRQALQFGNGTHLHDRDGIGRFGMGLPNSSLSQGERVEVWTWQAGPQSAWFSYLDVKEIASGDLREVPDPVEKPIPKAWRKVGKSFGDSGTIVVWARPNRCTWRTARAIVKNSEEVVGRVYRRYLDDGRVIIRMAAFRDTMLDKPTLEQLALPNDPMYLMERTSCPSPYDNQAMFEPWGKPHTQDIAIRHGGAEHVVVLTYSCAMKDARTGHNPGGRPYGKHAARNLGVSIVRADRELELDSKWFPPYDPVCRFIGIEVDFPPALDAVFGVTNNKQSATHLADLAGLDSEELANRHGAESYQALKEQWAEDSDIRKPLLDIKDAIDITRKSLMNLLTVQTRGQKGRRRRHDPDSPERKATEATDARKEQGHSGTSDGQEELDPLRKRADVEKGLIDDGVPPEAAEELAATTVDLGLKYVFGHAESSAGAFFSVKPKGGSILITLNTTHPAYEHLMALLEDSADDEETVDSLKARHSKALDALKLLLAAWARYEDEEPDGRRRTAVQEAREDWGRVARQFLEED